ncbi:MAG: dockerin type I domain-containing protein, partial [Candidatus Marinimicrobia bacterium]|nr:dockerin type I domain-containing protein [Candidatus Neomarinimicrobiota bacterium]
GDLLFDTMGDVNYDYQTDISDLIRLISIILGNLTASEYQLEVGDLNQDELVTIADILLLVDHILQ